MLDHLARRRLVLFEHILDQINSSARGIELVAEQDIGRASRRAEPAVNAGAQDLLGGCELRILQLCERERGLHSPATFFLLDPCLLANLRLNQIVHPQKRTYVDLNQDN